MALASLKLCNFWESSRLAVDQRTIGERWRWCSEASRVTVASPELVWPHLSVSVHIHNPMQSSAMQCTMELLHNGQNILRTMHTVLSAMHTAQCIPVSPHPNGCAQCTRRIHYWAFQRALHKEHIYQVHPPPVSYVYPVWIPGELLYCRYFTGFFFWALSSILRKVPSQECCLSSSSPLHDILHPLVSVSELSYLVVWYWIDGRRRDGNDIHDILCCGSFFCWFFAGQLCGSPVLVTSCEWVK